MWIRESIFHTIPPVYHRLLLSAVCLQLVEIHHGMVVHVAAIPLSAGELYAFTIVNKNGKSKLIIEIRELSCNIVQIGFTIG